MKKVVRSVVSVVKKIVSTIVKAIKSIVKVVAKILSTVLSFVSKVFSNVKALVTTIFLMMIPFFFPPLKDLLQRAWGYVANAFMVGWEYVKSAFSVAWSWLVEKWGSWTLAGGWLHSAWATLAQGWRWMVDIASRVWSFVKTVFSKLADAVRDLVRPLGRLITAAGRFLKEAINTATGIVRFLNPQNLGFWIALGVGGYILLQSSSSSSQDRIVIGGTE